MPKNPVFEFLRQTGNSEVVEPIFNGIPILPPVGIPLLQKQNIPEFSYKAFIFKREGEIIDSIYTNPHPTDVLADSSLWSPKRLDLVRQLLISNLIRVLPDVRDELVDIEKQKPSPMRELLFPEGELNPRLVIDKYSALVNHQWVLERYVNILHVRKKILEGPFSKYFKQMGRLPIDKDRSKIITKAMKDGISWRTIRMANKGDSRRRYTDEVIAVYGILSPILTGRDCIILTADNDIFDQVFQFSQLLHDDYGSFLIGRDYLNNPEKYPHTHKSTSLFMEDGATAVGRAQNPTYLLPKIKNTCATWVIDVNNLHCLIWISTREMKEALDFQEMVRDGRVADGGNGYNVHMSLDDKKCKASSFHFTIGKDKNIKLKTGEKSFLSEFDLFRACTDRKK